MRMQEWIVFWVVGFAIRGSTLSWSSTTQTECEFTRYPSLCVETMAGLGSRGQQNVNIVSALVNKTIFETKQPMSNFAKLSYHFITPEAQHTRIAIGYCHKLMRMSLKRLNQALLAVQQSPRKNKHDIQTWLSAALTFQQACKDIIADANNDGVSSDLKGLISQKINYLSQLVSNPLALVNRISSGSPVKNSSTGDRGLRRRLLAEEQLYVFPKWVSGEDRTLLESNTIKANAIVAKDGSGNYETIREAIQAASGNRFVIYVKSGVYKEKIQTSKHGITLVGDGKYSTIIVGDDSVAGGTSLSGSATFTITGDDFIAKDIGFQNTAGPQGEQAVALIIASDHSVLYRCSIAGYQDTLYALSLRQFYRECDIYGTVDFIFGNAAAVFQSCNLLLRRPRNGGYNVILANGRSDPAQNTGFSIQNCKITVASSEFAGHSFHSYLGRAWKKYSRSVVMQSNIDDAIAARGWIEWPGAGSSSTSTLYFAEYSNVGPGAATSNRVQWPGFHLLSTNEALKFTVANFIAGTSWLPSTGVPFVSSLQ